MSKVLVDRELLNSALKTIHGLAPGRFTVEEELRAAVTAQPAEAKGVEALTTWRADMEWPDEEMVVRQSDHLAAVTAVTAERDKIKADRKACWEELKRFRRTTDETERELRAEVERLQLLVGAGEEVERHLQLNSDVECIRADSLRNDAERYRWLIASGVNVTSVGGDPVRLTDQLVDAAMAAKEA